RRGSRGVTGPEPSLFDEAESAGAQGRAHSASGPVTPDPGAPLAVRMRPGTLDEVLGQQHLLESGAPLRRLVEGAGASSVILYGPPGTGKTTLASLISSA